MTDRDDEELGSSLSEYLAGYATYPRAEQRRSQPGGGAAPTRRRRSLLTAAIAVAVALVIAVPVGVTLLLRSGGSNSTAGLGAGPQYVGDLHMFTPTTGWAWGGGTDILHTNVGVQQWAIVAPPVGRLNVIEVAWVDAQSARVLASSGSADLVGTYQLVAWSTNDGGTIWAEGQPFTALDETAQGTYSASDLQFVDREHGWFFDTQEDTAGSPIFIFRTVDGGMHWSRVEMTPAAGAAAPGALPVACTKSGMTFRDPTNGWVTGSCVGGGPVFEVTHDGGATWSAQPIDCPTGCTLDTPQFTSSLDGFLVAAVSIPYLFATTDGGLTWTQRADLPAESVHFVNADDGFTLGLTGSANPDAVLWTTHDGGNSWREATSKGSASGRGGPDTDTAQINFANGSVGWANVAAGVFSEPSNYSPTPDTTPFTLWQTNDAGATWTLITPIFTRNTALGTGVVEGSFEAVGGAPPGTPRPLSGTITLRRSDGTVYRANTGSDGAFSIRVPTGSYTVTATSPSLGGGGQCDALAEPVFVTAGTTVTTIVQCNLK